ncbi:MAG: prefoldin subunit [Candidatus Heimdallarchaeota archaeon]
MSRSITPEQQAEIQQLQNMSQQLNTLQQNYLQLESKKRELERTLAAIKDLDDGSEIYRSSGQVLFKTTVSKAKSDLTEEFELLEVRVSKSKKQIEELDKRVKDKDAHLRASIQ